MRDRWVDIALISALVVIAGTIVVTLFGRPAAPRIQAGATPRVEVAPVAEVAPVEPETPEAVPEEIVPVTPVEDEVALEPQTTPEQPQATQETENAPVEPEVAEAGVAEAVEPQNTSATPLPEGAIDLERVGFSFVTGGVGACNVVLEPWQHVAVSLDLREKYPCGTEITITLNEEVAGKTTFKAIVGDSIRNAERTVNVYVGKDEPALEYGIKDGVLNP
jgi:hypothetical protein